MATSQELSIKVSALQDGSLKTVFQQINTNVDSLTKSFKIFKENQLGLATTVAIWGQAFQTAFSGIRAVTETLMSFISAAAEQETQELKLTAAMTSHGIATKKLTQYYVDLAKKYQIATIYSDEQIMSIQRMLTMANVMPSQMDAAIDAVTNLASATGKDLEIVAKTVARAINGNVTALGRLAPAFAGAAKDGMSFEQAMRAIKQVTGEQTTAEMTSFEGRVKSFKNAWSEFAENIGNIVLPPLKVLLKMLSAILSVLNGQAFSRAYIIQGLQKEISGLVELRAKLDKNPNMMFLDHYYRKVPADKQKIMIDDAIKHAQQKLDELSKEEWGKYKSAIATGDKNYKKADINKNKEKPQDKVSEDRKALEAELATLKAREEMNLAADKIEEVRAEGKNARGLINAQEYQAVKQTLQMRGLECAVDIIGQEITATKAGYERMLKDAAGNAHLIERLKKEENAKLIKLDADRVKAQNKIEEQAAKNRVANIAWTGTSEEGWWHGLDEAVKYWGSAYKQMEALVTATARGMHSSFSDLFFDAMTNDLKSLEEYFKTFWKSIARAIANNLSDSVSIAIMQALGIVKKEANSSALVVPAFLLAPSAGSTATNAAAATASQASNSMLTQTASSLSGLGTKLKDGFGALIENIGGFLFDLIDGLRSAFSTISKSVSSLFSGGSRGIFSGLGSIFSGDSNFWGDLLGIAFHKGGIVGQSGGARLVPRLAFTGVPRYHSGAALGLRPDEVPLIAQIGEGILSRKTMEGLAQIKRGASGTNNKATSEPLATTVIHEHHYRINAVDAQSFYALVKRNPSVIVEVTTDALQKNVNRGAMRKALGV